MSSHLPPLLTILRNAEVYAPDPLGRKTLVVGGERILWIGDDLPAMPGQVIAHDIDLAGERVIPGLVDGHAHPTGGGGEAGAHTRVPAPFLSSYTTAGVTSVVGLLGTDGETRTMGELLAQTRALREEGLSAWCYTGGYHNPPTTLTGSIRGDIVHLDPVIGWGEFALSDFRSSQPTLDDLLRMASEAQVGGMIAGKSGICHLHMGDGLRGLDLVRAAIETSELPASTFHPTHVNRRPELFQEALDLVALGAPIDLTAFPVEDGDRAITAEDALGRYLDADLPRDRITVSSDSGGCLPTFDAHGHLEHMDVGAAQMLSLAIQSMLAAGRPLEQFLPAFTSNPARVLGLRGKGRLEAGADADLAVLDAAGRPRHVMARGAWHVRDGVPVIRGTFETHQD